MELRDLIGERAEDTPRAAPELQNALGPDADRAVERLIALIAGVQSRVEIRRIVVTHREDPSLA